MVKHGGHRGGVSYSCLWIELGLMCNSMTAHCDLRVVRTTTYLKAIMEVYEKKNIYRSGPLWVCRYTTIINYLIFMQKVKVHSLKRK